MLDPAGQGALGFDDADQAQAQGRAFAKGQPGDVEQRLGIVTGGLAHRDEDRFVDRLLADAADHQIGQPEQGVVEVGDLQERLDQIDPEVASLDVRQFVKQHRVQVVLPQLRREVLRDQDHRAQQSTDRGTGRVRRDAQGHRSSQSHTTATGIHRSDQLGRCLLRLSHEATYEVGPLQQQQQ